MILCEESWILWMQGNWIAIYNRSLLVGGAGKMNMDQTKNLIQGNQTMLDGKLDQLRHIRNTQLLHHPATIRLNRLRG